MVTIKLLRNLLTVTALEIIFGGEWSTLIYFAGSSSTTCCARAIACFLRPISECWCAVARNLHVARQTSTNPQTCNGFLTHTVSQSYMDIVRTIDVVMPPVLPSRLAFKVHGSLYGNSDPKMEVKLE